MNRQVVELTLSSGEILEGKAAREYLKPLTRKPKPAYKPPKRRRPRNDPLVHLAIVVCLMACLVMFVTASNLYNQ